MVGPSGSGKSSLVAAGLLPALQREGGWQTDVLRPGPAPPETVDDLPVRDSRVRHLLVVDQFEEIFTLVPREKRVPFQDALLRWRQGPNRFLVATVRADFYPDLMQSRVWDAFQANHYPVLPLGREGLREAIVKPAEALAVFVEPALVERLLNEAADEPGVLPHVQETLVRLWKKRQRRFLPLSAYTSLDRDGRTGLQVAMALRADAALNELPGEGRAVARRIFLRLVQFGEGRPDTRRRQSLSRLGGVAESEELFKHTLEHLTTKRLLVQGQDAGAAGSVDIAHEALIPGWPTLQKW